MDQKSSSASSVVLWLIGGLLFLVALFALWIGFFRGPDLAGESNGLQVAQVSEAGGEQVPDDAPLAEVLAPPPSDEGPAAFAPEQSVVVTGAEAVGGLRVHADAQADAPVLEVYADGEVLTILDPSGDYSTYPVLNDNATWYRVRDQNGLVSWAESQFLSPAGQ